MIELKVDKSLLINNFDTYKLSLQQLPTSKQWISEGVSIKHPNDEQFSFLHHKEFSLHNHLYEDLWNENDVYFITSDDKVKRALINFQTEKILGLTEVWKMPRPYNSKGKSNFNASINFPSSKLAVITDGSGFLFIIDTLNRKEILQWKTLHSEEVLGEGVEFKITCSRLEDEETSTNRKLHCILLLIDSSIPESAPLNRSGFEVVLKWVIFTEGNDGNWKKTLMKELRGGSTDNVFLELGCQAMYVISDTECYSTKLGNDDEQLNQQNAAEPDYQWQQTSDQVKLWLHMPACSEIAELKIEPKINSLNVCWRHNILLSGSLFQRIDPLLTTWTFHNSKLEIIMQKVELGVLWTCLLRDCTKVGKEVVNEEFVAEVHAKLAHLCSENEEQGDSAMLNSGELEECDAFGDSKFLTRFHIGNGSSITHKVFLGSEQWLFSVKISQDRLPAFCIRRDVDGLVYQPAQPQPETSSFQCQHIHTFPAFGYIAASRTDKKFLVAPPNLSYVAIVNCVGHVIVFRKVPMSDDSVLRNRKTAVTTKYVYTQNLVNLDSNCQTVGAVACNKFMYILTTNELVMININ